MSKDYEWLDEILGKHSVLFNYSKAETRAKLIQHIQRIEKEAIEEFLEKVIKNELRIEIEGDE